MPYYDQRGNRVVMNAEGVYRTMAGTRATGDVVFAPTRIAAERMRRPPVDYAIQGGAPQDVAVPAIDVAAVVRDRIRQQINPFRVEPAIDVPDGPAPVRYEVGERVFYNNAFAVCRSCQGADCRYADREGRTMRCANLNCACTDYTPAEHDRQMGRNAEQVAAHQREVEEEIRLRPSRINNYTFKPSPKFYGRANNNLFFGIELEVESQEHIDPQVFARNVYEAIDAQESTKGLFYFKHDSSLVHGVEIVTHPMSFNFFDEHWPAAAANIITEQSQNNWLGEFHCGVHIHMSRDAFGKFMPVKKMVMRLEYSPAEARMRPVKYQRLRPSYHLVKFMEFIYNNAAFVQQLAGREHAVVHDREMATYNKLDVGRWEIPDRKNPARIIVDSDRFLREAAKGKPVFTNRYTAVNLANKDTIELRIFRSTTNHRRLRAYMQFADSLFYYTDKVHLHDRKHPERAMSIEGFKAYTRAHPTRYADLIGVFDGDPALAI